MASWPGAKARGALLTPTPPEPSPQPKGQIRLQQELRFSLRSYFRQIIPNSSLEAASKILPGPELKLGDSWVPGLRRARWKNKANEIPLCFLLCISTPSSTCFTNCLCLRHGQSHSPETRNHGYSDPEWERGAKAKEMLVLLVCHSVSLGLDQILQEKNPSRSVHKAQMITQYIFKDKLLKCP